MATKRPVLEQLRRHELQAVPMVELEVENRRGQEDLIDAAASSWMVELEASSGDRAALG